MQALRVPESLFPATLVFPQTCCVREPLSFLYIEIPGLNLAQPYRLMEAGPHNVTEHSPRKGGSHSKATGLRQVSELERTSNTCGCCTAFPCRLLGAEHFAHRSGTAQRSRSAPMFLRLLLIKAPVLSGAWLFLPATSHIPAS